MKKSFQILILGKGRIGKAIAYYLKENKAISKVAFFSDRNNIQNFNLLIGALPGKIGEKSLRLALREKKNLIDLADLENDFYLKQKRKAEKNKILVIPNCGFCPGLIDLILGREISRSKKIEEVEVKVGTLSPKKFFFPFLWCFEDLIWEHQNPSWQIINSKKKKFLPFSGYQKDKFFGIEAETYFSQSGFENFFPSLKTRNFKFRVIRPLGFAYFFQFLKKQGFLAKRNLEFTKRILENQKEDNLTIAEIKILTAKRKIIWNIKSFSRKSEKLNSMQKITGLIPAVIAEFVLGNKIKKSGILFTRAIAKGEDGRSSSTMKEIGRNEDVFQEILRKLKKGGIFIKREEGSQKG